MICSVCDQPTDNYYTVDKKTVCRDCYERAGATRSRDNYRKHRAIWELRAAGMGMDFHSRELGEQ